MIGCDLCPPQARARGSCLTLRRPPSSLKGMSLPAPTFSPPGTAGARDPGGESRAAGGVNPLPVSSVVPAEGAVASLGCLVPEPQDSPASLEFGRSPWIQLQRSGARPPQLRLAEEFTSWWCRPGVRRQEAECTVSGWGRMGNRRDATLRLGLQT